MKFKKLFRIKLKVFVAKIFCNLLVLLTVFTTGVENKLRGSLINSFSLVTITLISGNSLQIEGTLLSAIGEKPLQKSHRNSSSRSPRQMKQITAVLRTMGCIPKFFCGMSVKEPTKKTTSMNDLGYLLKLAMTRDDSEETESQESQEMNHARAEAALAELQRDSQSLLSFLQDPVDTKMEEIAEDMLLDEGEFKFLPQMLQETKSKSSMKYGTVRHTKLEDGSGSKISQLLSKLRSFWSVGRSSEVGSVENLSAYWSQEFLDEMEFAARVGESNRDRKTEDKCTSTFDLCPYSMSRMKQMIRGEEEGPKTDLSNHRQKEDHISGFKEAEDAHRPVVQHVIYYVNPVMKNTSGENPTKLETNFSTVAQTPPVIVTPNDDFWKHYEPKRKPQFKKSKIREKTPNPTHSPHSSVKRIVTKPLNVPVTFSKESTMQTHVYDHTVSKKYEKPTALSSSVSFREASLQKPAKLKGTKHGKGNGRQTSQSYQVAPQTQTRINQPIKFSNFLQTGKKKVVKPHTLTITPSTTPNPFLVNLFLKTKPTRQIHFRRKKRKRHHFKQKVKPKPNSKLTLSQHFGNTENMQSYEPLLNEPFYENQALRSGSTFVEPWVTNEGSLPYFYSMFHQQGPSMVSQSVNTGQTQYFDAYDSLNSFPLQMQMPRIPIQQESSIYNPFFHGPVLPQQYSPIGMSSYYNTAYNDLNQFPPVESTLPNQEGFLLQKQNAPLKKVSSRRKHLPHIRYWKSKSRPKHNSLFRRNNSKPNSHRSTSRKTTLIDVQKAVKKALNELSQDHLLLSQTWEMMENERLMN